jgi:hypothetical protein
MFVGISLTCVGFWIAHQLLWIRERHEFLGEIDRWRSFDSDYYFADAPELVQNSAGYAPPQAPWSLRIFGERPVAWIEFFNSADDEWRSRAKELFPEAADKHQG